MVVSWVRLFEAATRDLDADAPIIRGILDEIAAMTSSHAGGAGYRLDSEAQLAMGWWFFAIHVKEDYIRDTVTQMHAHDKNLKDEGAVLEYIRSRLKEQGSSATIKMHTDPSVFARYWTWLLR